MELKKEQCQLLEQQMAQHPFLQALKKELLTAYTILADCFEKDGKLLVCGNGGSAADADHIVGELMKQFKYPRALPVEWRHKLDAWPEGTKLAKCLQPALPAINLAAHSSLMTAFSNDVGYESMYAQQVFGYGRAGDVLLTLSTSGSAANVIQAAVVARATGMSVLSLTGERPSRLSELSNVCLQVPQTETWKIQDMHHTVYHVLCLLLELHFWPSEP